MLENFIYAKQKSLFEEKLNNGEVLDEAIVFIEDTKEIWNHGTYFDGSTFDSTDIEASILNALDTKADKTEIPTKVSDLENDSIVLVSDDLYSYYITNINNPEIIDPEKIYFFEDGRILAKGRVYSKSDVEFMELIPTKVSELENDVPYVVDTALPEEGIYAVRADGSLCTYEIADSSCIAVALITGSRRIMIAKDDARIGTITNLYWGTNLRGKDVAGITETTNGRTDFNGKANTAAIIAAYTEHAVEMNSRDMCKVLQNFNITEDADWYIPSAGQLYVIYMHRAAINEALIAIGGTAYSDYYYWSSSEHNTNFGWSMNFGLFNSIPSSRDKSASGYVRFVQDFTPIKPLKERVKELENTKVEEAPNDREAYLRANNSWMSMTVYNAIDLSKQDIYGNATKQNTANCYVVKEAGTYKFPCVYGNAIKDGYTNSIAYSHNGGDYSHDFVNYAGNLITDPWISTDTGETIDSAQLSIADTDSIFSNITVSGDYVMFTVDSVPDTGANGVISIKNSEGIIMWNWHIWVWKDDLTPVTITNYTGVNYNILPVNLASKWITNSNNPTLITNWYYQWGRSVPLAPATSYNSDNDATTYGTLSYSSVANSSGSYQQGITNPTIHYGYGNNSNYNWFGASDSYYNLWDQTCTTTGCSDNTVVKTVYDPCPPGFKMPNGNTFTGFTTTGSNTSTSSLFNIVGSFNNGWYFKKNSSDTTGIFFPALGHRIRNSGSLYGVGLFGYVWSAAVYSQNLTYYFDFDVSRVYPLYSNNRAYGFSVRPVAE